MNSTIKTYFRVVYHLLLKIVNNLLVYIHRFLIQTEWLHYCR